MKGEGSVLVYLSTIREGVVAYIVEKVKLVALFESNEQRAMQIAIASKILAEYGKTSESAREAAKAWNPKELTTEIVISGGNRGMVEIRGRLLEFLEVVNLHLDGNPNYPESLLCEWFRSIASEARRVGEVSIPLDRFHNDVVAI